MLQLSEKSLIFAASIHDGWRDIEESDEALTRQRICKFEV